MTKPSGQQAIVQALEKQIEELKLQPGTMAREEIKRLEEQVNSLQEGASVGCAADRYPARA